MLASYIHCVNQDIGSRPNTKFQYDRHSIFKWKYYIPQNQAYSPTAV